MSDKYFTRLAYSSLFISTVALVVIIATIPPLLNAVENEREFLESRSLELQEKSNALWENLEVLRNVARSLYETRNTRSVWHSGKCRDLCEDRNKDGSAAVITVALSFTAG
ncbi:unnamed protein product [Dracunculus medinensis]|uniref:Col_cuticle_N domain-containing protein n=1 Tax=Dracunculus medinensis TaxID=318479 RepID=A0A0N4UBT6_DRAME|nr:unnamed protein product [Dracunculus medinensis]